MGYFFGFISGPEAERLVKGCEVGTFLLRFSSTHPGAYTATFLRSSDGKRDVQNVRIFFDPGTRLFSFEVRRSDGSIICANSINGLIEAGREIGLTNPLMTSPLSNGIEESKYMYVHYL